MLLSYEKPIDQFLADKVLWQYVRHFYCYYFLYKCCTSAIRKALFHSKTVVDSGRRERVTEITSHPPSPKKNDRQKCAFSAKNSCVRSIFLI